MLNRYGLIDIDKILREQGEPPPPVDASQEPPPEEKEDPDEAQEKARSDGESEDLDEFRRTHADAIYALVRARGEYGMDATLRSLKMKFEDSGVDKPFIAVLDQQTTGMKGEPHIAMLAKLHNGAASGGAARFKTPGEASSFAEVLNDLYDDTTFDVDPTGPTTQMRTIPELCATRRAMRRQRPRPPKHSRDSRSGSRACGSRPRTILAPRSAPCRRA